MRAQLCSSRVKYRHIVNDTNKAKVIVEGQKRMANMFDKGAVVVLKSGGPPMTVDEVPGDVSGYGTKARDTYLCRWFAGAKPAQGAYAEHLLDKFTPPAKR